MVGENLPPSSMLDINTLPFSGQCKRNTFLQGKGPSIVLSSKYSDGRKRTWICRKQGAMKLICRPWLNERTTGLPHLEEQWQGRATVCYGQLHRGRFSVCSRYFRAEFQTSKVCKNSGLESIVKPLIHFVKCLELKQEMPLTPYVNLIWNEPSSLVKFSHRCTTTAKTSLAVPKVLGRVLLFALFFVISFLRPFPRMSAPAYAVPPADVNTTSQPSEGQSGRAIKEKLREFHCKIQYRKKRYEEARRNLEELYRSKEEQAGKQAKKSEKSPYNKRVTTILEEKLESYRQRVQENANAEDGVSIYEKKLKRSFEEGFLTLESFGRESVGRQEALLLKKARELTESLGMEGRSLQGTALRDLDSTLAQLKQERTRLIDRLRNAISRYLTVKDKVDILDGKSEVIDKELQDIDSEVAEAWERVLYVDVKISRTEAEGFRMALEILPRLEQQFEDAVSTFINDKSSSTRLQEKMRQEKVVNDLKETHEMILVHKILPKVVDIQQVEPPVDSDTVEFLERVKLEEEPSKTLRETVTKLVKEDIEAEQAMTGDPVIAPNLKKWEEEKKAELKQFLLKNPEVGHQYVAQKQEQILLYRDRVLADTWYDEKHKRWEISPEALGFAVEKELVESARIRHDRAVMFFKLKGEDRVYYADLKVYDFRFQEYGGRDGLHLRMLASGVPVSVDVMWIPFNEWDPIQLFVLPFEMFFAALSGILQSGAVTPVVNLYVESVCGTIEDLFARIFFPVLEKLPKQAQIAIGLQLTDNATTPDVAPFLMELKKFIQKRMEVRYGGGEGSFAWWLALPVKCFVLWIPFVYLSRLVGKVISRIFGPGEEMNEVEWKEKKGKAIMKKLNAEDTKEIVDPVRQAFDKMKRIKESEVSLKDFAGLDIIKGEINEIVTFLRDPSVFKEMGARPPRGVLIVGEPGTGKTSLAMAIAAEAKVPMVELDGLELEGGAWVGQGASNVRDLFKMARESAPVIIFMDDFDYFAGIRGDSGDTRKQDHESLINQLLVELDGFETQDGVVLLATSSRPGNIDEALRRPGRIDRTIMLPMPNKRERELVMRRAAQASMDHALIELVDWKEMARKTEGMTPQQLKVVPRRLEASFTTWKNTDDEELFTIFKWLVRFNKITPSWVANTKWMKAWKNGLVDWLGLRVTKEDIEAAVECIDVFNESRPGLEMRSPGYIWTREFKFPHAVWAAGRGLVGLLLPNFDTLQQIWLDQTSWEGIGFTRFTKRMEAGYEETKTITRSYYEKKLVLCFGSSVAARLLLPYGENNDLSKHEIQEAKEIVASMVLEFGWGSDDSQTIYAFGEEGITLSMGDELERELNLKAAKLFDAALGRAADMIQKNKRVLEALVEHLLQFDAISQKDMTRILEENGAIYEDEPFMLFPYRNEEGIQVTTNGAGVPTSLLSATNL